MEVQKTEFIRPTLAELVGQSRPALVLWHKGFCYKNDQDRLAPGPLHQTFNSGAVPDLATSDSQDAEYFDSMISVSHDCTDWPQPNFTFCAPRHFEVFPYVSTDFQSFSTEQSTPDPAFESPTEPLRGELQRLHALRHQNSDVLRAVQISPEVTAKSCPYPTYQQAGLLTVLRSNSDP